jgi:hypothetical protein
VRDFLRQMLQKRRFTAEILQKELLDLERSILEKREADQERDGAAAAGEARRLGVENEYARWIDVGESNVEREPRDDRHIDAERIGQTYAPVMVLRVQPALDNVQSAVWRSARRPEWQWHKAPHGGFSGTLGQSTARCNISDQRAQTRQALITFCRGIVQTRNRLH